MALFNSEMLEAFDAATGPVNEAGILPPSLYTSSEFHAFERTAIFDREWICVGRVEQVPNSGDWFQITLLDDPLLVVRDKDGEVRVLSAVCQHRGMLLVEGSGTASRFLCPYHHWCYGLDGRLVAAPEMDKTEEFERAEYGLPSLPVEIWNGFIFTNFDPGAAPLAPTLTSLTPLLENFDLENCHHVVDETFADLPWNWKVMLENFNDGYHAHRLHEGIGDHVPGHNAKFLDWDDDDGHVTRLNYCTHMDGSFNPTLKCMLPVFTNLTDDERHRVMFALIPPTLGLAITPDSVTYFIVDPKSVDKIDIHIRYCLDPRAAREPLFAQLMEQVKAGVNMFNVQDIYADTMVQKGLSSRFGPHGRYSWQEETLQQFNRWLVKRYRAAWPQADATDVVEERQSR